MVTEPEEVGVLLLAWDEARLEWCLYRSGTQDHLASSEAERRRIVQAGGKVAWRVNTWRVGDAGIEVRVMSC